MSNNAAKKIPVAISLKARDQTSEQCAEHLRNRKIALECALGGSIHFISPDGTAFGFANSEMAANSEEFTLQASSKVQRALVEKGNLGEDVAISIRINLDAFVRALDTLREVGTYAFRQANFMDSLLNSFAMQVNKTKNL